MFPLQMLFVALLGWLDREQRDAIAFLREENRTLKAQLAGRRLHVNGGCEPRNQPSVGARSNVSRVSNA